MGTTLRLSLGHPLAEQRETSPFCGPASSADAAATIRQPGHRLGPPAQGGHAPCHVWPARGPGGVHPSGQPWVRV